MIKKFKPPFTVHENAWKAPNDVFYNNRILHSFLIQELTRYGIIFCFNQQTVDALDQWEDLTDLGKYFVIAIICIIIHQTHYEKSDWSRAFNQFTIACELDMINAISAADIAFNMSSSTSAWLPSPLECSPQKQNG